MPPTVYRDGPFGPGSVQLWVEQESDEPGAGVVDVVRRDRVPAGWLHVLDAQDGAGEPVCLVHADHADLARMAALDVVLNNADRKGGHVLDDGAGGLVGRRPRADLQRGREAPDRAVGLGRRSRSPAETPRGGRPARPRDLRGLVRAAGRGLGRRPERVRHPRGDRS